MAFNDRLLTLAPERLWATFLSAANSLWSALSPAGFCVLGRVGDVYGLE